MTDSSAEPRLKKKGRRPRVGKADLLVFIIVGALAVVAFNLGRDQIFSLIYNPTAGLIVLIMIVEFLWLKSGDRTRLYRLENDRLRTKLRKDEDLLKRGRDLLHQAIESAEAEQARPVDWHQQATRLQKDIDDRV
ncbi:hypothetical protein IT570_06485 [Candidatus Sumerlaeota bacterium]|nr:hypothetical protein [Candidatus Sumerlaeota bacterium]